MNIMMKKWWYLLLILPFSCQITSEQLGRYDSSLSIKHEEDFGLKFYDEVDLDSILYCEVSLQTLKKRQNDILTFRNLKELFVYGHCKGSSKTDIRNKSRKPYRIPASTNNLALECVPLPLFFDFRDNKTNLKSMTIYGCPTFSKNDTILLDFSQLDSLSVFSISYPANDKCFIINLPNNIRELNYAECHTYISNFPEKLESLHVSIDGCFPVISPVIMPNLKTVGIYKNGTIPLSETILSLSSLKTIIIDTLKFSDINVLAQYSHLDTLVILKLYDSIPQNLKQLTNISVIKIDPPVGRYKSSSQFRTFASEIQKILPMTAILYRDNMCDKNHHPEYIFVKYEDKK
jgi:hypothetical protein